ncbi:nitric oxide reductase activation protein NorD [Thiorhodospira sibirica]|uniref:nitric oxide reductase activation protein NorD n=1 Tax=Thiorhodospira sibirica TaxID=154347 RepID=UPI00022C2E16|nr:nitric oxide reductase activation protein NorD [Thiorhodospira sibirica]
MIDLQDYKQAIAGEVPEVTEVFEACYREATRVMSPQGLHNYLEGAKALTSLGRGKELPLTYMEEMPLVVKEVGEDIIIDCISEAMKLASMVSGEVIRLMFDTLPTAARRLGDAELLRQYLQLLHQLSAKAPRGLRPMLGHLDLLLSQLTLSGLRRWALWGAQAHARDFEQMIAYFSLQSADSQKVLQQERRGTLFIDTHRRLNFYLRALWGRDFFLRPMAVDYENPAAQRAYIDGLMIYLPDAFDDYEQIKGSEIYRAASAHAAAHLMYTRAPLSAESLNPLQMFCIGLFEDARVECLAIAEFPGLKQLWRGFHAHPNADSGAAPDTASVKDLVAWLERLALALLDTEYQDTDSGIMQLAQDFHQRMALDPWAVQHSWDLGVALHHHLRSHFKVPSLRLIEQGMGIIYRDDNRIIWEFDEHAWEDFEYLPASQRQVRKYVNVMEMVNEIDCELAGDDAQEIWVLQTELFPYEDEGISYNQMEGKEPVSEPAHYQEWDYQVQLYRPDWVTVIEKRQDSADAAQIDRILQDNKPVASRLRHIIDALIPEGIVRQRRQEDGDEIDINAAIHAMVDLRLGSTPDNRINIRYQRKLRDLAVLLLLDLSESTNEALGGSERTVIELTREATALLAYAVDAIGDPFAIHGFASDSRHEVQYYRFKDFNMPYDDKVKARLAGMRGGLSTRMGGAFRHAASLLKAQPQQKKLLLLVSDGEPADIDVKDPQYLRYDTKKAVEELARDGIMSYCLTLDPHADEYVGRIFGVNGFTVVDHVNRLPERLPMIFANLTR